MNHSYISVSELPYEIHSCKRPDPVKDTFFLSRGCPLTRASTVLQFGKGVNHMEAVVWEKYLYQCESVVYFEFYLGTLLPQLGFVRPQKTVLDKKQSNLVPLPRGEGTPIWKTKTWNSCRKPIWTCLTLYLSLWTGLHQDPASLRCYISRATKKYFFPKHEDKATSIFEFEKTWDHL